MKSTLTKIFVLLVSVGLVSCSSTNNQPVNNGMGAESGQTVAMGSGAGVGMVGGDIGQSMDSSDTIKSYAALEHNPKNKANTGQIRRLETCTHSGQLAKKWLIMEIQSAVIT